MKVLITVDHQFKRTPDGRVWVKTIYGYDFWRRYLQVFDSVKIVGRLEDVQSVEDNMLLSSGERVEFHKLPQYSGIAGYIKSYYMLKKSAHGAIENCDCAIFRIPSPIASMVAKQVKQKKIPFAVEIVNDPWDTFRPGSFRSVARPIIRVVLTHQVKNMSARANGASYVTKEALQRRYPSRARTHGESEFAFESYYSSIILDKSFLSSSKKLEANKNGIELVHTNSSIIDFSKGHHIVIDTIKILREKGINCRCTFIGDGPKRYYFQKYAASKGVGNYITFTGLLAKVSDVRKNLLNADIFLLPTTGEGLPRCIIEAMAVGLPCLSTKVNGIPELLDDECLLPLDGEAYAKKIFEWIHNPAAMEIQSERNIQRAREYIDDVLNIRRVQFYTKLNNLAQRKILSSCIQR